MALIGRSVEDIENPALKQSVKLNLETLRETSWWFHELTVEVFHDRVNVTRKVSPWFGGLILGATVVVLIAIGGTTAFMTGDPKLAVTLAGLGLSMLKALAFLTRVPLSESSVIVE